MRVYIGRNTPIAIHPKVDVWLTGYGIVGFLGVIILISVGGTVQQMMVCNSPKKLVPSRSGRESGRCGQMDRDLEVAMSLAASERPALAGLRVEPPPNLPGREPWFLIYSIETS